MICNVGDRPACRVLSEWPEKQQQNDSGSLPPSAPAVASASPDLASAASDPAPAAEVLSVLKLICLRLMQWITGSISANASKATNKEFPLTFEEEDFSLKPSNLDLWMKRRAADKKVGKAFESTDLSLSMIQLKVMDVISPVVDLYAHVSSARRESAIYLVDPDLEHLLKEKGAIPEGKKGREWLFIDFFKDRRVQEARIDNYLSMADKNLAEAAVNS